MLGKRIGRDDDEDEKTARISAHAIVLLRRASSQEPTEDRRSTRPGDQRVLEAQRAHARHDAAAVDEEDPLLLLAQTIPYETIPFAPFDKKRGSPEDTVRIHRWRGSGRMSLAFFGAVVFGAAFGLWFARNFL